ncbi:MAG: serine/threonine-protein kinase [Proteobacteria bacterium]|nr:serine/threonine-protein kinase [Pseudomonadota bacterium]
MEFEQTLHTPTGALASKVGKVGEHEEEAYCPACSQSFMIDLQQCPNDGARLVKLKASRDPLIGRVFEQRYEIRTTLGEGGMGTVYRGWQLSVDREVAIKVVHPSIASDRTAVKRFLREARLSSRLSQPNIVNVYDFGQTEDGILYLVMELLRGNTLGHELASTRAMPMRRVLTIALQLCDALQAAHSMGIIHRDLKPGNVVVLSDPPGRDLIKVLDFGLAKSLISESMSSNVTNTNAILGTPLYMAPEQIEGKATDQRADIYALGCMLHQMLTGRPPFLADNANMVLAAHLSDPVPPLPATVPRALVGMIESMMAKAPEARPSSVALVRTTIEQIVDGGYGASDLADTTPDIPRDFQRIAALAQTIAPTVATVAAPVEVAPVPPAKSRAGLAVVALGIVALATVAIVFATRNGAPAAAHAPDAAIVVPVVAPPDAALPPPLDGAVVVDAPANEPVDAMTPQVSLDAGRVRHPKKPPPVIPTSPRDAAVPQVAAPDAGKVEPKIDFLKVKKGDGK